MYFRATKTIFFCILLVVPLLTEAQLPKWIVGSSEQNASGAFYSYGTNNIKFYELNFSGALTSTPRVIGTSIQNIRSVGTQDVIQTAVDTSTNTVLFYAFIAALGPYNGGFPAISPDTVYFAAYDPSTGADEVFAKTPTDGWGASVEESELVRRPGSSSDYYFIYKTQATSLYNDNIKYVTVNTVTKTISAPIAIVASTQSGEGMAVSQLNCSNQRWLFVTRPESDGDITLRRCAITNSGISLPTDIYTISIPGNSIGVICAVEIAPTNNLLAVTNFTTASVNKRIILFDYNNTTGSVSSERSYSNSAGAPFCTLEFSPNASRMYIMQGGTSASPNLVYNCPVVSTNYTVTSANLMTGLTLSNSLTLELAYDGKIYINPGESSNFMYFIPNPNSTSLAVSSTPINFFGISQRMGSGFPDQVDGDRNPVSGLINASISSPITSICSGQSLTLTGFGGTTYQWSGGVSATTDSIIVSPVSNTTYYLQASSGTCVGYDTVSIVVNPFPVGAVSGSTSICSGQSTTLTASGAGSYQWSGGSSATTSSITVSPAATTVYTVTPSNGGCSGISINDTVHVTASPVASIVASNDSICSGQTVNLIASGGSAYQWTGGSSSTSSSINVSPVFSTTYYLQVSNGSCSSGDSIRISVTNFSSAQFTYDNSPCNTGGVIFVPASAGVNYYWSFGDGILSSIANPSHPFQPGTYNVELITNPNTACADTAFQTITVTADTLQKLIIPNVFTPNGDGLNDEFKINGLGVCQQYSIEIYNRWGQKVFDTDTPETVSWNGKNGQKSEIIEGVYFYILTPKDNSAAIKGAVTLIR